MRSTPRTDATARNRVTAADGLSLVEMLVALLLLGVILTAAASSLIQFMRTAADNERRVQATALMNSLHEEFQALPWREAVVYEGELQELLEEGFEGLSNDPQWEFDGEELVTLPGPVEGARRTEVPEVTIVPTTSDGRDYQVNRFVTWSDRASGIKRFTTIVQWSLYNRTYQERFFSERAATATEAGDPERPRVVQFQVGPSPMQLTDLSPAQNAGDISVTVRFSSGVDTAVVRYQAIDSNGSLVDREVKPFTPYITDVDGRGVAWRGTITANTETFPRGTRNFQAIATLGADEFRGSTSMVFRDDAEPGEVTITDTTLSPMTVCLDKDDRFVEDVTVKAFVDGLDPPDYIVSATYSTNGSPKSETLEPVSATFTQTGAEFRLVLKAGTDHGFNPKGSNPDQTDFVINALNPESESSDTASTGTLSVFSSSATVCK